MSEQITIKEIKEGQGGWRNIFAEDGKVFSVGPGKNFDFKQGKSYHVVTVWKKDSKGKNRAYILDSNESKEGLIAPVPENKVVNNGNDSIEKIATAKNESIEKASILKAKATGWAASAQMAEAVAKAFASTDEAKSWDWYKIEIQIRKVRQMEYVEYLKSMGLPEDVPF